VRRKNRNNFLLENNGQGEGTNTYFTLSFSYDFEANKNDEVWFAHAIPFTYTQLNKNLVALRDSEDHKTFLKVEMLGLTLGKLPIPMITITDNVESYTDYSLELRMFNKMPQFIRRRLRKL